jgi:branched-chain amino acid transport system permease protein
LRGLVVMFWGTFPRRFPALFGSTGVVLGPFTLSPSMLFGIISAALIVGGLWWMFNRTRIGLTMSAVAEDHQTAMGLGISVKRSMSIAWGMSGGISVIAAVAWLCGRSIGQPVADIGMVALPCVLLAGLESVPGALVAGIIVGIAESLSMYYLDPLTEGGMSLLMPFLIMLLVLIIRPEGLFGWKRIERL